MSYATDHRKTYHLNEEERAARVRKDHQADFPGCDLPVSRRRLRMIEAERGLAATCHLVATMGVLEGRANLFAMAWAEHHLAGMDLALHGELVR